MPQAPRAQGELGTVVWPVSDCNYRHACLALQSLCLRGCARRISGRCPCALHFLIAGARKLKYLLRRRRS